MRWDKGRDAVDQMIADRLLQRVPPHREHADRLIAEAERHLASARRLVTEDPAGAFALMWQRSSTRTSARPQ